MTNEEVEKFIEAAVKNGHIVVAQDVWEVLQAYADRLTGIKISVSKYLPPGQALTFPGYFRWPGTGTVFSKIPNL